MFGLLIILIQQAHAVRLAMEPQNRLLVGYSHIDGGQGTTISFESRLTQLIYVNMGGFTTLVDNAGDIESSTPEEWLKMNHAIWAAPGWRVPHRYKDAGFNWDLLLRGGFACVFTDDVFRDDLLLVDPSALAGVDVYLHKGDAGLRVSNRMFFYQPEPTQTLQGVSIQRLQSSVEVFWQWD